MVQTNDDVGLAGQQSPPEKIDAPDVIACPTPSGTSPQEVALQEALPQAEAERLAELEPIIERALANFLEGSKALLEIRDRRLYRQTHSTFQDYVRGRWKMTARRAYQLCTAAEVVKSLPEDVNHGSQINERQARELAKVDPDKRAEMINNLARKGRVTAKAIKGAAKGTATTMLPQALNEKPQPVVQTEATKLVEELKRQIGVKPALQLLWSLASEVERAAFLRDVVKADKGELCDPIEDCQRSVSASVAAQTPSESPDQTPAVSTPGNET